MIVQRHFAEQFVGQQLITKSSGSMSKQLFYWQRNAKGPSAEVDFLIERKGKIYPIEVKSGKSGRLKSLHMMLNTYENLDFGICLQNTLTSQKQDNIIFSPLFTDLS